MHEACGVVPRLLRDVCARLACRQYCGIANVAELVLHMLGPRAPALSTLPSPNSSIAHRNKEGNPQRKVHSNLKKPCSNTSQLLARRIPSLGHCPPRSFPPASSPPLPPSCTLTPGRLSSGISSTRELPGNSRSRITPVAPTWPSRTCAFLSTLFHSSSVEMNTCMRSESASDTTLGVASRAASNPLKDRRHVPRHMYRSRSHGGKAAAGDSGTGGTRCPSGRTELGGVNRLARWDSCGGGEGGACSAKLHGARSDFRYRLWGRCARGDACSCC